MRRIASLVLVVLVLISFLLMASGALAQEVDTKLLIENGKPLFSAWHFFILIWFLTLGAIFLILNSHDRKRKQKITVSGEKNDKEKDRQEKLSEKQLFWLKNLLAILGSEIFILILGNGWWFILITIITLGFIYLRSPELALETIASFNKNAPKPVQLNPISQTTFKDVGGLEEAIEELQDVVSLYKNPKEAEDWDIRLPRGILLIGPPGCGKTLLARAIAGETGLTFFSFSGAQIGNSYVRSGAQELENIFKEAQKKSPCVVFLDEIDALGKKRGYDTSGEFDHALNELLHEMDGIQRKSGILVLAATNREDVLDDALLRPGRFDKKILIPHPDLKARQKILEVHTLKKHLSPNVSLEEVAKRTPGFNGATLEQLTNEAAQLARRRYEEEKKQFSVGQIVVETIKGIIKEPEKIISKDDLEEAILRVCMGPSRKLIMNEQERRIVARHEIGHAVVTAEKKLEVLDKVTLMPRNWALGLTISYSEEQHLLSRALILARIVSLLGGRAAEEIFLGKEHVTTGAGNDFEKAEELARRMICEWGMGDQGPGIFCKIDYATGNRLRSPFSENTASEIDKEVRKIILSALEEAKAIILAKKETVAYLAELLMEKTVLNAKEITDILNQDQNPALRGF